jgi:hypothetical protein
VTKRFLLPILLFILLVYACSAQPTLHPEQAIPTAPVSQVDPVNPTSEPTQETDAAPVPEATLETESEAPDCLGGEFSPIGQSIAADYEFTDYPEVITWFCNGAEFEDILVALETESLTGTPAEEMLQMLADDFTWDEIWQLVGLTE